jgi:hypothetical protein
MGEASLARQQLRRDTSPESVFLARDLMAHHTPAAILVGWSHDDFHLISCERRYVILREALPTGQIQCPCRFLVPSYQPAHPTNCDPFRARLAVL